MIRPMNWNKVINDIIESGLSEAAIAKKVGTNQPTINRIKSGVTTKVEYSLGVRILSLRDSRKAAA